MSGETAKARNVAPVRLQLLITVVPKKKAAFYMDLIQSYDVNLQVSVVARGTADTEVQRYLGLTDLDRCVIYSVVREDHLDALTEMLEEKFRSVRNGKGIAVSVPFTSMIGTALFGFLTNDRRAVRGGTNNE